MDDEQTAKLQQILLEIVDRLQDLETRLAIIELEKDTEYEGYFEC